MEMFAKLEGLITPSAHRCCAHAELSLCLQCSTYEEHESLKAQVVMLTGEGENQGHAQG